MEHQGDYFSSRVLPNRTSSSLFTKRQIPFFLYDGRLGIGLFSISRNPITSPSRRPFVSIRNGMQPQKKEYPGYFRRMFAIRRFICVLKNTALSPKNDVTDSSSSIGSGSINIYIRMITSIYVQVWEMSMSLRFQVQNYFMKKYDILFPIVGPGMTIQKRNRLPVSFEERNAMLSSIFHYGNPCHRILFHKRIFFCEYHSCRSWIPSHHLHVENSKNRLSHERDDLHRNKQRKP